MTVTRAKGDKAACDRLFSQLVRARGVCEYPGCERRDVVCAHIIGRRFSRVRTCEDNALAMCPPHHFEIDNFPDTKMWLVEQTIGRFRYFELVAEAQRAGPRFDWSAERERLKALVAEMAA